MTAEQAFKLHYPEAVSRSILRGVHRVYKSPDDQVDGEPAVASGFSRYAAYFNACEAAGINPRTGVKR